MARQLESTYTTTARDIYEDYRATDVCSKDETVLLTGLLAILIDIRDLLNELASKA